MNFYLHQVRAMFNNIKEVKEGDTKFVLVLDDSLPLVRMTTKLLKKLGYSVEYALDGKSMINKFKEARSTGKKYEFLIIDIVLPHGMSGDRVFKEILSLDPTTKGIVCSGYIQSPVMLNYHDYGFVGALEKPYTFQDIKTTIAKILV